MGAPWVGLAPLSLRLALHRRAIPVRRLELLATGEPEADEMCSDYVGVLCDGGYEGEIARELARLIVVERALGRWDELLMPAMSSEDLFVEGFRHALFATAPRMHISVAETGLCPYIALPKTWDGYLKSLESSSRYVVTRASRELEKWAGKGGAELVQRLPGRSSRRGDGSCAPCTGSDGARRGSAESSRARDSRGSTMR